jgi:hypothetical protein
MAPACDGNDQGRAALFGETVGLRERHHDDVDGVEVLWCGNYDGPRRFRLQFGIGLLVGFRGPFRKCRERIVVGAISTNKRPASFFGAQTLAPCFCSPFFHNRAKAYSFDSTDFRKTGGADDEARFAGFPVGILLLCHAHSIPNYLAFRPARSLQFCTKNIFTIC